MVQLGPIPEGKLFDNNFFSTNSTSNRASIKKQLKESNDKIQELENKLYKGEKFLTMIFILGGVSQLIFGVVYLLRVFNIQLLPLDTLIVGMCFINWFIFSRVNNFSEDFYYKLFKFRYFNFEFVPKKEESRK